jgi:hypothetical protein
MQNKYDRRSAMKIFGTIILEYSLFGPGYDSSAAVPVEQEWSERPLREQALSLITQPECISDEDLDRFLNPYRDYIYFNEETPHSNAKKRTQDIFLATTIVGFKSALAYMKDLGLDTDEMSLEEILLHTEFTDPTNLYDTIEGNKRGNVYYGRTINFPAEGSDEPNEYEICITNLGITDLIDGNTDAQFEGFKYADRKDVQKFFREKVFNASINEFLHAITSQRTPLQARDGIDYVDDELYGKYAFTLIKYRIGAPKRGLYSYDIGITEALSSIFNQKVLQILNITAFDIWGKLTNPYDDNETHNNLADAFAQLFCKLRLDPDYDFKKILKMAIEDDFDQVCELFGKISLWEELSDLFMNYYSQPDQKNYIALVSAIRRI